VRFNSKKLRLSIYRKNMMSLIMKIKDIKKNMRFLKILFKIYKIRFKISRPIKIICNPNLTFILSKKLFYKVGIT